MTPAYQDNSGEIHLGEALATLKGLPAGIARTCVTSPPYWGLRDYGTASWEGGSEDCDHLQQIGGPSAKQESSNGTRNIQFKTQCKKCGAMRVDQQIGLEQTPEEYIQRLGDLFDEVRRVLADDGTLWLNLGDSYAGSGKGPAGNFGKVNAAIHDERHLAEKHSAIVPSGMKPKDLVGIPWMAAFELRRRGWYLRADIIWHKPNPMPESVTDRTTKAHEYIFLMSKSSKYFYDADAIKEQWAPNANDIKRAVEKHPGYEGKHKDGYSGNVKGQPVGDPEAGRNKRSVWTVATHNFEGAHFATFPPDLIVPCILAGSRPGDVVLDPFMGSGTTALVAKNAGRRFLGTELNPEYLEIARGRLRQEVLL